MTDDQAKEKYAIFTTDTTLDGIGANIIELYLIVMIRLRIRVKIAQTGE